MGKPFYFLRCPIVPFAFVCLEQLKYQHEQQRLKQEWERAQKEVEEDERRYHEEVTPSVL